MRLFRFTNKAKHGVWVFAESEQEAKELAVAAGYAKTVVNLKLIGDQTDFYQDKSDIQNVTVKGIAALQIPGRIWIVWNPITQERK